MELTSSIKNFDDFSSTCNHFGIEVNNNQLELFKKYHDFLSDWNKKINLISRKEENILERHFLDSILFLPEFKSLETYNLKPTTILDIGSGGGFPAIPLAIMKPEWTFTLCESIKKKSTFLTHLIEKLNISNHVTVINNRVESLHSTNQKYNFITARAVTKLDELVKYSLPLLKKEGYLLAYKAKDIDDELKNIEELIKKRNLKVQIFEKDLNGVGRKIVAVKQTITQL